MKYSVQMNLAREARGRGEVKEKMIRKQRR